MLLALVIGVGMTALVDALLVQFWILLPDSGPRMTAAPRMSVAASEFVEN